MACLQSQSQNMTDSAVSQYCENANAIIAAAVRVRSAALSRDQDAVDAELANLRDVTDTAITLMETAGVPWAPYHPCPVSIEELRGVR